MIVTIFQDADDDKWDCCCGTDPFDGVDTVYVYLYYKKYPRPSPGTVYECINDEGNLEWIESDDYTEKEWEQLQVAVLSMKKEE